MAALTATVQKGGLTDPQVLLALLENWGDGVFQWANCNMPDLTAKWKWQFKRMFSAAAEKKITFEHFPRFSSQTTKQIKAYFMEIIG